MEEVLLSTNMKSGFLTRNRPLKYSTHNSYIVCDKVSSPLTQQMLPALALRIALLTSLFPVFAFSEVQEKFAVVGQYCSFTLNGIPPPELLHALATHHTRGNPTHSVFFLSISPLMYCIILAATFYIHGKEMAENPKALLLVHEMGHDIGLARFTANCIFFLITIL